MLRKPLEIATDVVNKLREKSGGKITLDEITAINLIADAIREDRVDLSNSVLLRLPHVLTDAGAGWPTVEVKPGSVDRR